MGNSHEIDARSVNLRDRLVYRPHLLPDGATGWLVNLADESWVTPNPSVLFTEPDVEKVCYSPSLDEVVTPDRSALDVLEVYLESSETQILKAILRGSWLDYAYQGCLDV